MIHILILMVVNQTHNMKKGVNGALVYFILEYYKEFLDGGISRMDKEIYFMRPVFRNIWLNILNLDIRIAS